MVFTVHADTLRLGRDDGDLETLRGEQLGQHPAEVEQLVVVHHDPLARRTTAGEQVVGREHGRQRGVNTPAEWNRPSPSARHDGAGGHRDVGEVVGRRSRRRSSGSPA